MAFLLYFSDDNQIEAGQQNVMEALVDVMLHHKANPRVTENAAGALLNICVYGGLIIPIVFCRAYSNSFLNTYMHDAFL